MYNMSIKRKEKKLLITGILIIILSSLILYIVLNQSKINDVKEIFKKETVKHLDDTGKELDHLYLSDISYKSAKSGHGSILMDKTASNTQITLMIHGASTAFEKGIWAHATSEIIYDLTNYNEKYTYFTTYYGVCTTSGNRGNGVKFFIQTSNDLKTWTNVTDESPKAMMSSYDANFAKIDIRGVKYLKLYANDNGSNGNDHSVWADAKLIKEGYKEPGEELVPTVEELDNKIKTKFSTADLTNKEYELTLLQRELINNVGQYALRKFVSESDLNKQTYTWLTGNLENLRLYIMGGKPDGGSYYNSLNVLSQLYDKYKSDFEIKTKTKYGTVLGDLYKRMAITLSLTHSSRVALWMQPSAPENQSNAVTRYQIYKDLHKNDKFVISSRQDHTKWFEELKVEEMRYVLNNIIDDEEILWLNEYTQKYIDAHPNKEEEYLQPHHYMKYIWPNYGKAEYHDEANKEMWSKKYGNFLDYGVTFRPGLYKLWMNLDNGAVCGGISKIGSNIRAVHGTPSAVIGQPGHAAIIYYRKDAQGRGYWSIDNDVSGWAQSERGERKPLGWGNDSYVKGYNATYIMLAQEALNHFDEYEKSEKLIILASIYNDNPTKKEQYLREALKVQSYNIDAWWELIKLYQADKTKTEAEYFSLAEEMAEKLKAFPLPMYNLTNLLKTNLKSPEYAFAFTLLQNRILTEGSVATSETVDVYQPSITRTVAKYLLGQLDKNLATFSFDGENAGKIILSSRFDGSGVRWDYSLDGKNKWKEVSFSADEEHKWQLTKNEIDSITADTDIYIHIVGMNYEEKNIYKIDITKQATPTLYNNDLENRVMGTTDIMEWRFKDTDTWTSYAKEEPDLTGDKTVQVRKAPSGTGLASDIITLSFTQDDNNNKRKYIKIAHLSIHNVSSEATSNQGNAAFCIDGNYNTRWHSAWNGSDNNRYITIKLDKPVMLSAMEYFPCAGGNGKILQAQILGSMDGENFTEIKNVTWANNDATKTIEWEEPVKVQYIKLIGTRTSTAGGGSFIGARMFNFFEDVTNSDKEAPTADIQYDITELTNKNVVAKLVNPSKEITITNNGGKDTYTFTENGEFTFEFEDNSGNKGTAKAKVDWIRKTAPTATISYNISKWTNKDVVATLNCSEEITVTNNDGKKTYTFTENGEFEFIYTDKLGNEGKVLAKVVWIDKKAPVGTITYNINDMTNKDVIATLSCNEEITVTNNDGKKTYTFTENGEFEFIYVDKAGNEGRTKAKVDWIQKNAPKAKVEYDITELTNKNVTATISSDEEIIITNNNGSKTYVFTENGEFTFEYEDRVGNKGRITAKVDWIQKEAPKAMVTYDIESATKENVTATLECTEDITVINNDGSNIYTFVDNGEFEFIYTDRAGNEGRTLAKVDWIDRIAPVAKVIYDNTKPTANNVIATLECDEEIIVINNEGSKTYTFTENGEFEFIYEDKAGNEGRTLAIVNWINKELPEVKIKYDIEELTRENVTATLECEEEITILNNGGSNTYVFTENGSFEFQYISKEGLTGYITATVDWIQREAPEARVEYDIIELTNKNVTATLVCDEEIEIVNNDGNNKYVFTENGEFEFIYTDRAGNEGRVLAKVDWINKKVAMAKVEYDIKELTNKNVIATLVSDEEIEVTNNDGKNTYVFTKNGEFEFEYIDKLGNKGTVLAKVSWIQKEAPKATVKYDIKTATNKEVTATLECEQEIIITNNVGRNTYVFTDNGEFEFIYLDKLGNRGTALAKVDWIDKKAPKATVKYDIKTETNKKVTATLESEEEIIITNNDGKNTYIFTENGEFEFIFTDKAGNEGRAIAKVDWIVKKTDTDKDDDKNDNKGDKDDTDKDNDKNDKDSNQNNNKDSNSNSDKNYEEDREDTSNKIKVPFTGTYINVTAVRIGLGILLVVLIGIAVYISKKLKKHNNK